MSDYAEVKSYFGLNCPDGGSVYICAGESVEFVGCCTSDPCSDGNGCPPKDLRFLSFNPDIYDKIPVETCDNSTGIEGQWYACKYTSPSFLGCCEVNACSTRGLKGCPRENLVPGILSSVTKLHYDFLNPDGMTSSETASAVSTTSSETASAVSTASSNTTSGVSTISSETASATNSPSDDDGLPLGAIVGISVGSTIGGLLLLAVLVWRFWFVPKRRRRQEREAQQQPIQPSMIQPGFPPHFGSHASMGYYQGSLIPSPTAPQYPSGVSSDIYGKTSPNPSNYEPPVSTNVSDISSVHGRQYPQGYSPGTMVPLHEMEATNLGPQEMGTGQEHAISPFQTQSPPQSPTEGQHNPRVSP